MKDNKEIKPKSGSSGQGKVNVFRNSFLLILLVVLLIDLVTILFFRNLVVPVFLISIAFLLYYGIVQSRLERSVKHRLKESLSALSEDAGTINENISLPMVTCNEAGSIVWCNSRFREIFGAIDLNKMKVEELFPTFDFEELKDYYADGAAPAASPEEHAAESEDRDQEDAEPETGNAMTVSSGAKFFDVIHSRARNGKVGQYQYMLYFYEITPYKEIKEKYEEERAVLAILELDNFEDLMNELKEDARPKVQAEIEEVIYSWAKRMNAMIRKFDRSKYLMLMGNRYFQNVLAKRFDILDRIREIEVESNFPPTMSIGICTDDRTYIEMERGAFSALEIALGRGGDQAAVKSMGDYSFYGGKAKAIEKRNRVKARLIAHAFRPIIDSSNAVYIMGHQYPDMDALGAAVGIYKAASDRGIPARIVLEEPNETIISVYNTFKDRADEMFIKPDDALQRLNPATDLVVVVDTHRPSYTECPELLKIAQRKVVIDHHRRSLEMIEDTLLTYLEPYASSACELVTEVLQYMENKPILNKNEANALLAGMVLDTKNFSVKSGVRTFETAALLRRFGADPVVVKEFMQDDLESIVNRSKLVSNARKYTDDIAISVSDKSIDNPRLIAAQAADQMLTIRGINTSFVIVKEKEKVCVSARSLKDFNVQVIMERLGGGGHRTSAATQIEEKSVFEVEAMLIREIERYLKEGE